MVTSNQSAQPTEDARLRGDALRKLAEERVREGLAPPPGIYRVEHRRRVAWSHFPTWARPVDPEIFDGCCHEG